MSKRDPLSRALLPGAVLLASAVVIQLTADGHLGALLPASTAPTKPYATFAAFWSRYMAEHSQPWTQRLHFIGTGVFVGSLVATTPALLLCVAAACAAGYAAFPFLRGQPSGALEFALMLGTYVTLGRATAGSWRRAIAPMVVAYAFAWVGHFFVEGNRPATFVYPSFSLIGDFRMLYEALAAGRL